MQTDRTDQLLAEYRKSRRPELLAELFDLLAPSLFRLAMHFCKSAADAEDVIQATFLAIIEKCDDWDPDRPALPWITGILRNRAREQARAQSREAVELAELGASSAAPSSASPEELDALSKALDELPESDRRVIVLSTWYGMTPAEIAHALDDSPGAIRVRLHRALKRLRQRPSAGLAGLAFPFLPGTRGLGTIRKLVIAKAKVAAPTAITTSSLIAVGVLAMSAKTIGVIVFCAAVVAGLWSLTLEDDGGDRFAREGKGVSQIEAVQEAPRRASTGEPVASGAEPKVSHSEPPADPNLCHVSGRVVDESGMPIAGARIALSRDDFDSAVEAECLTAEDGRFRSSLERQSGRRLLRRITVTTEQSAPLLTDLRAEATGDHDLGDLVLERGTRISGRVLEADSGTPIAGAQLFWGYGSSRLGAARRVHRPLGLTLENGSFVASERLPSTEGRRPIWLLALTSDAIAWRRLDLVRGRDALDDIEIHVHPPGILEVEVVDELGATVSDAMVRAVPLFLPFRADGKRHSDRLAYSWAPILPAAEAFVSQRTDDKGLARLVSLPLAPKDRLHTRRQSCDLFCVVVKAADGRTGHDADVRLPLSGDRATRIRITVRRAKYWELRGRVTDVSGVPVAGARVIAQSAAATADASGEYRVVGTRDANEVWVRIEADGYATAQRSKVSVSAASPTTLDVVLEPAFVIAGRVVGEAGEGVATATVWIREDKEGANSRGLGTDDSGAFRFGRLTSGNWLLRVTPPKGSEYIGLPEFRLGPDQEDLVLTLERAQRTRLLAEIVHHDSGSVADPTGVALYEVLGGDPPLRRNMSVQRRSGSVTVDGLRPGSWLLEVEALGTKTRQGFEIAPGTKEQRLRMEVGRAGSIFGRLVLDGVPPELLPKSIAIVTDPTHTGRWVDEDGKPNPNVTPGFVAVPTKGNLEFRMDGIPPKRTVRLRVVTQGLFGEATFAAPFDTEERVSLRVCAGVQATFQIEGPTVGLSGSCRIPDVSPHKS